ncbi:hypothetical protein D7D52_04910 [Nocardia yunnanensis]|uniref:Uncharacterized protein n=1 Tax=Nocardia yunnanensis TaxID=2382165 RepID=A0A386Z6A9_9NOCA|nr:hypothetical protein [Nocardia yunnanensis]AYF73312.1 hypothetical protein D7D52_04910 [Nocardia yunnanensis]
MTDGLDFEGAPERARRLVYLSVAVVLVALAIAGVIIFKREHSSDDALHKAQVLQSRLLAAGFDSPDPQVIADSLGEDGGLVCSDPSSPLIKARYAASISNGAAGPGSRPVIADTDVFTATSLAIETYCPDKLAAYLETTGHLEKGDTLKPDTAK